jgi:predicted hydrocarbon binding protein
LDELSHHFADLTGFILSSYYEESINSESLYWLGYNLGKWIYIIDAFDDLEKDMQNNKFNALNSIYNEDNKSYLELVKQIKDRVDFTLTNCAQSCLECLNNLPIHKNYDLLHNILQFGLMEKVDKVFKG